MINVIDTSLKIGVFYKDSLWRDEIFESLIIALDKNDIVKISKYRLVLYGGNVIINFIPANDNCRGYKFDRIYYQNGISDDFLDFIIKPQLYSQLIHLQFL